MSFVLAEKIHIRAVQTQMICSAKPAAAFLAELESCLMDLVCSVPESLSSDCPTLSLRGN